MTGRRVAKKKVAKKKIAKKKIAKKVIGKKKKSDGISKSVNSAISTELSTVLFDRGDIPFAKSMDAIRTIMEKAEQVNTTSKECSSLNIQNGLQAIEIDKLKVQLSRVSEPSVMSDTCVEIVNEIKHIYSSKVGEELLDSDIPGVVKRLFERREELAERVDELEREIESNKDVKLGVSCPDWSGRIDRIERMIEDRERRSLGNVLRLLLGLDSGNRIR